MTDYYAISNRKRDNMGQEKTTEYAEIAKVWPKDIEVGAVDPTLPETPDDDDEELGETDPEEEEEGDA